MSAIVAASAGTASAVPRSPRRRRGWRPVLAATAATLLLPVGLAVAGVDLPRAIERPYRAVGITLPDSQHDTHAPATRTVIPPQAPTPATPRTTSASPAQPSAVRRRARHGHAGNGQRHNAKRHAKRANRSLPHTNRGGASQRPTPRVHVKQHGPGAPRHTGPTHRSAAPKPGSSPKKPKSPPSSRSHAHRPG